MPWGGGGPMLGQNDRLPRRIVRTSQTCRVLPGWLDATPPNVDESESSTPISSERKHAVTRALIDASQGNAQAAEDLWTLTYEELRRIAYRLIQGERADHTLSGTALVHEAFVRLIDQNRVQWQDRAHFFAVAAQACRRILIDHARRHRAQKRGGGRARITIDRLQIEQERRSEDLIDLNEALERLSDMDERLGKVVEFRYFGGLSEAEIAEVLDVSERTVRRDWVKARAWLHNELQTQA